MSTISAIPNRNGEIIVQNETQIQVTPSAIFVPDSTEEIYQEAAEMLQYDPNVNELVVCDEQLPFNYEESLVKEDESLVERASFRLKLHDELQSLGLERLSPKDNSLRWNMLNNKLLIDHGSKLHHWLIVKANPPVWLVAAFCSVLFLFGASLTWIPSLHFSLGWKLFDTLFAIMFLISLFKFAGGVDLIVKKYKPHYESVELVDVRERLIPVALLQKMVSLKKKFPEIKFTVEISSNPLVSFQEKREFLLYKLHINGESFHFHERLGSW